MIFYYLSSRPLHWENFLIIDLSDFSLVLHCNSFGGRRGSSASFTIDWLRRRQSPLAMKEIIRISISRH
jgi:hypothetical protein